MNAAIVEVQTMFKNGYHFEIKRMKMRSDSFDGDVHLAILQTYSRDVRDSSLLIIFHTGHEMKT